VTTAARVYRRLNSDAEREQLILRHLALVRHIVGRLKGKLPRGLDVENLEAAGVLGLVEAANRFDPDRGIRFETFAYARIRGAVFDELRRNCPLPQHLLERIATVRAAHARLPAPVTAERLAEATGLTADEVAECLGALRLTRVGSWEDLAGPHFPRRGESDERPSDRLEQAELHRLLSQGIRRLPDRERLVVTLYYLEDLRLKEIGQLLDLSESRVSRLLKTALFHLEEFLRAKTDG
jgi:RNA polymerase sigma factor for flagellar operon FliA